MTDVAVLLFMNCLIQQPTHFTKSFAILGQLMSLSGLWSSRLASVISWSSGVKHF